MSMTRRIVFTTLLVFAASELFTPVFAQDAEDPAYEDTQKTGQEVEISEDNYRRFMELKDDRIKRSTLPLAAYEAPTGPQKIEALPQASQKHLRNQLREIILESDQWVPSDARIKHPYVPSEAALNNRPLQNQEAAAWDELLEKYNQREAENYARANAANDRAAKAGEKGQASPTGDAVSGQIGQKGAKQSQTVAQQSSQQDGQNDMQQDADDSYSPSAHESDEPSTAGTSQSALQFLQKNRMAGASGAAPGETQNRPSNNPQATSSKVQAAQSTSQQATSSAAQQAQSANQQAVSSATQQAQSASQQTSSHEARENESSEQQASPAAAQESESSEQQVSSSTAQESESSEQQASSSTAREHESSEQQTVKDSSEFRVRSKDTLSIKDLVNARGVSVPASSASNTPDTGSPDKPPDGDGDG